MALDAGVVIWTFPALGQTTDAGQAIAGNCTPGADKVFFLASANINIVEVGAMIGTATAADTYAFTVSTAPIIGGAYTLRATVTGPAATIIAAGTCLKKAVDIDLIKGNVLRFTVTDATAAGTAMFYAIGYPSGDQAIHLMGALGATAELVSTT